MRLVMNGDDLGYTRANSEGIFQAFEDGILRSTTALTNSKYFEEYVRRAESEHPGLGVGVHLTLTLGRPLTENRTLKDPATGEFYPGYRKIWEMDPDYDEIYREWKAQIERFIQVTGHLPTHLDSHHSVHDATPQAKEVSSRLAGEYGLQLRRYSSFEFVTGFMGPVATADHLIELLEANRDKDIEIMCHPGWCDLELYRKSSYALPRVQELAVLCDPQVIQYVNENQIELCHY